MGEDRPSNRREPREVLAEPPARRRDPTRRSALIAGAVGLVVIVLLVSVQCGGSVTAPSPATPTATGISPLAAEQMTATAVAAEFPVLARRPLHLPTLTKGAPCPLVPAQRLSFAAFGPALGQGPVYAAGFNLDGTLDAASPAQFGGGISGWGGMKIVWNIAPGDAGPAVVRGQQIDGSHALRFNGGEDQANYTGDWAVAPLLPELRQFWADSSGDEGSYVRLQAPGCYAMQVDGLTFSEVIVFQAVFHSA